MVVYSDLRSPREAICNAVRDEEDILDETCGFIFLGTPHQGSAVSVLGAVVAYITGFLGSNTMLLRSLVQHKSQLSDLNEKFMKTINLKKGQGHNVGLVSFIETKPTYLFNCFSIGLVGKSALSYMISLTFFYIVNRDSASGTSEKIIPIDTDHSGLNKCARKTDRLYTELESAIKDIRPKYVGLA